MEVKTTITVDLARPSAPAIVYAKQLDRLSRYITAKLYANGGAFTPPAGVSFEVRGLKPDGTVVVYSKTEKDAAAVTQSGSTLTIYIAQQAVPGTVRMELAIKSGTAAAGLETLTTFSWLLQVEESAASGTPSTNYINPAIASVASAAINAAGHLILTMTTGATIDAGLAKGADGTAGAKGDPGTDGTTPTIGANGNWFLGDTDTGKPSRGEKGNNGTNGFTPTIADDGMWQIGDEHTDKPSRGEDGTTPTVGANGNWFLGSTDTGKPSRGEKGADGAPGKGLDILGTYPSLDALSAAVTAPAQGDIYQVGEAAPYTLYMWDGTAAPGAWTSLGELQGPAGAQGEAGRRGSIWFTGTAISGTPQGLIGYPNSGIELALAGDMYLNISASTIYQCFVSGDAATARWKWIGTIKGATGAKGDTGPQGPAGSDAEVTAENVTSALAEAPLPVASGGTGAATADAARSNIGALSNADGAVTRSKLAQDALSSPIQKVAGTVTLSQSDIGKTLLASSISKAVFTITKEASDTMPEGAEIAIMWYAGDNAPEIKTSNGIMMLMNDKSYNAATYYKIRSKFGLIALKKLEGTSPTYWTILGDVEVFT